MRLPALLLALVVVGCDTSADPAPRCVFTADIGAPFDTTLSGTGSGIRGIGRFDSGGDVIPTFEVYLGDRRTGDLYTFTIVVPTTEDDGDDVRGMPPPPGAYALGVGIDQAEPGMAFVGLSRRLVVPARTRTLRADRGELVIESSSVEAVRGRFSGRFVEEFYLPPKPNWTADTTAISGTFVVIPGRGPGSAPESQRPC